MDHPRKRARATGGRKALYVELPTDVADAFSEHVRRKRITKAAALTLILSEALGLDTDAGADDTHEQTRDVTK